MPASDPLEFDCVECGAHVFRFVSEPREFKLCALCLFLPGWHRDPELVAIFDPDRMKPPG